MEARAEVVDFDGQVAQNINHGQMLSDLIRTT